MLSDYVKYGLSIDGVPDNFNSSKWLTGTANDPQVVEIDDSGTEYDSAMLLQTSSNRVRPYIKISPLLEQIKSDFNEDSDVQLLYDDYLFFNEQNPYITNGVLSGKLYSTDDISSTNSNLIFKNFSGNFTSTSDIKQIYFENDDIILGNSILDLTSFTVIPEIHMSVLLSLSGTLNTNDYNSAVSTADTDWGRQFTSNTNLEFRIYLEELDKDNNPTGTTRTLAMDPLFTNYGQAIPLNQLKDDYNTVITPYIFETTSGTPTFDVAFKNCQFLKLDTEYVDGVYTQIPVYNFKYSNLKTQFLDTEYVDETIDFNDNKGVTDSFPIHLVGGNIPPAKYRMMIKLYNFPNNFYIRQITTNYNHGNYNKSIGVETLNIRLRTSSMVVQDIPVNGNTRFVFRNNQPYQQFNGTTNTLENQFIISKREGILPGSIVSLKDMINIETSQGDFLINFAKMFGLVFDQDYLVKDKTIRLKTKNKFFEDYSILDWTDKIDYSQDFKKTPISFSNKYLKIGYNNSQSYYASKYSEIYDTSYGDKIIDTGYEFNSDTKSLLEDTIFTQCIPVKGEGLYNNGPVPGFFSKENKSRSPIDDMYCLLFWNQDQSDSYKQEMIIFDDSSIMHNEDIGGDDKMCFIDSSSYAGSQAMVIQRKLKLPVPSILRKGTYATYSYDIGYPRANFASYNVVTYPSSSTIYNNFLMTYMNDIYKKNTNIITAYVYLTPYEMINFSFKNFVKIEDTIYHPIKINDYNPLTAKPVQIEMIKVNDLNSYVNGQNVFYDYANITLQVITDYETDLKNIFMPTTNNLFTVYDGLYAKGKFIKGQTFLQQFKYVGEYNTVLDKDIYYLDEDGNHIVIDNYFDDNTLTFNLEEPIMSDIYMTINVIADGVTYYDINLDKDNNAVYTFIEPDREVSSIKLNNKLTIKVAANDDSYKLQTYYIQMGNRDISKHVFSQFTNIIEIENVTGDIYISVKYTATDDILIPYVSSAVFDDENFYTETDITIDSSTFGIEILGDSRMNKNALLLYSSNKNDKFITSITENKSQALISLGNKNDSITGNVNYTYTLNKTTDSILSKSEIFCNGNIRGKYFQDDIVKTNNLPLFIYDTTAYYNGLYEYSIPENLTPIVLFANKSTDYNTAMYADFYYLQTYDNQTPKQRIIPVLHYQRTTYRPMLYNVATKTYLNPKKDNLYLIRGDSELMHEDIYVQYIGNQAEDTTNADSCFFETNIDMSYSNTYVNNRNIEVVCAVTKNDTHTFVSWSTSGTGTYYSSKSKGYNENPHSKYIAEEKTFYNGIVKLPNVSTSEGTTIGVINYYYGNYCDTYNSRMYQGYSNINTDMAINEVKRISLKHNFNEACMTDIINDVYINTSLYSSYGKTYCYPNMGDSYLSIFKDYHYHSSSSPIKDYSIAGMRIFDIIIYNIYHNKTNELVPILHYTGTKLSFVSDEGIKAPEGYEPAFKDLVTGICYTATQGIPTFGFNHQT